MQGVVSLVWLQSKPLHWPAVHDCVTTLPDARSAYLLQQVVSGCCSRMADADVLESDGDWECSSQPEQTELAKSCGSSTDEQLVARDDKLCWLGLRSPHTKVTNNSRYCAACKRHVDRATMQARSQSKLEYFIDKEHRSAKGVPPP